MDSLIVIITLIFFAAGLAYGRGAGTIKDAATTCSRRSRSRGPGSPGLLFLFLLIAQFIAYFNYSNIAAGARGEARRLCSSA